MIKTYVAQHEGRHLCLAVKGRNVHIKESSYLKVGETMEHPPGYFILLVVGEPGDAGNTESDA